MEKAEEIKKIVKKKYSNIALATEKNSGSCGCGCGNSLDYSIFAEDYSKLEGYVPEADLQLGCGIPTESVNIQTGDTVVDLGSGAGNDCFLALRETGVTGKVIGIDMSEPMVLKAKQNAEKLKLDNVEFILAEIENIPLADDTADVVISNCVLNLVPSKNEAFREIYRIMKPGGHFSISDIVLDGELPAALLKDAEMYAGCVAGALQEKDYISIIRTAGFKEIRVERKRRLDLPEELLEKYDVGRQLRKNGNPGIYSITVSAKKAPEAV